jgi:hypothetical protein
MTGSIKRQDCILYLAASARLRFKSCRSCKIEKKKSKVNGNIADISTGAGSSNTADGCKTETIMGPQPLNKME